MVDEASPRPLSKRQQRIAQRLQEFQEKKRKVLIADKVASLRAQQSTWCASSTPAALEARALRYVRRFECANLRRIAQERAGGAPREDDVMSIVSDADSILSSQPSEPRDPAGSRGPAAQSEAR